MQVTVTIKSNYGNKAVYPACDTSAKLADLLGTKTFTASAIRKLQGLGYVFQVQQETL